MSWTSGTFEDQVAEGQFHDLKQSKLETKEKLEQIIILIIIVNNMIEY